MTASQADEVQRTHAPTPHANPWLASRPASPSMSSAFRTHALLTLAPAYAEVLARPASPPRAAQGQRAPPPSPQTPLGEDESTRLTALRPLTNDTPQPTTIADRTAPPGTASEVTPHHAEENEPPAMRTRASAKARKNKGKGKAAPKRKATAPPPATVTNRTETMTPPPVDDSAQEELPATDARKRRRVEADIGGGDGANGPANRAQSAVDEGPSIAPISTPIPASSIPLSSPTNAERNTNGPDGPRGRPSPSIADEDDPMDVDDWRSIGSDYENSTYRLMYNNALDPCVLGERHMPPPVSRRQTPHCGASPAVGTSTLERAPWSSDLEPAQRARPRWPRGAAAEVFNGTTGPSHRQLDQLLRPETPDREAAWNNVPSTDPPLARSRALHTTTFHAPEYQMMPWERRVDQVDYERRRREREHEPPSRYEEQRRRMRIRPEAPLYGTRMAAPAHPLPPLHTVAEQGAQAAPGSQLEHQEKPPRTI